MSSIFTFLLLAFFRKAFNNNNFSRYNYGNQKKNWNANCRFEQLFTQLYLAINHFFI